MSTVTPNYGLHVHSKSAGGDSFSDFVDNNNADMQAIDSELHALATKKHAHGAHDAIVYIQDDEVIAEDAYGDEVESGEAGVDDAAVIQSVIAASQRIVLSADIFYTSADLNIDYNDLQIVGMGIDRTIIRPQGAVNGLSLTTGYKYDIDIGGITIDGLNQTGGLSGIKFYRGSGRLHDLKLYRTSGFGISADTAGLQIEIDHVWMDNLGRGGIHILNNANASISEIRADNMASSNAADCVISVYQNPLYSSRGNTAIHDVHIEDNGGNILGIRVYGVAHGAVSIDNVHLYNCLRMGIIVQNTGKNANFSIFNCHAHKCLDVFLNTLRANNVSILGCTAVGVGTGTPTEGEGTGGFLDIFDSEHITVLGCSASAVGGPGIEVCNSSYVDISGCRFSNPPGTLWTHRGILIRAYGTGTTVSNINICDSQFWDNQATATNPLTSTASSGQKRVAVTTGSLFFPYQRVQLVNGALSEYAEIDYVSSNNVYLRNNLTNSYPAGATIQGIGSVLGGISIREEDVGGGYGTISGVRVKNCFFDSIITNPIALWAGHGGTGHIFLGNVGYVTEASGSSAGTGSEQMIAHGLVATPSKVVIVPTVTGATVSAVWADGTNIYCTVTTGKTYNWSAEV